MPPTGSGNASRDIECLDLTAGDLRGQFGRARQELGRGVEGLPSLTKDYYPWLVSVNGSSSVTSDVLLSAIDLELRTFGTVWQSATGDLRDPRRADEPTVARPTAQNRPSKMPRAVAGPMAHGVLPSPRPC